MYGAGLAHNNNQACIQDIDTKVAITDVMAAAEPAVRAERCIYMAHAKKFVSFSPTTWKRITYYLG